jgi:hypothetical protein
MSLIHAMSPSSVAVVFFTARRLRIVAVSGASGFPPVPGGMEHRMSWRAGAGGTHCVVSVELSDELAVVGGGDQR